MCVCLVCVCMRAHGLTAHMHMCTCAYVYTSVHVGRRLEVDVEHFSPLLFIFVWSQALLQNLKLVSWLLLV